jgi:hypothetical protein
MIRFGRWALPTSGRAEGVPASLLRAWRGMWTSRPVASRAGASERRSDIFSCIS